MAPNDIVPPEDSAPTPVLHSAFSNIPTNVLTTDPPNEPEDDARTATPSSDSHFIFRTAYEILEGSDVEYWNQTMNDLAALESDISCHVFNKARKRVLMERLERLPKLLEER